MKQAGAVSLWIGQADSASSLDDYFHVNYSEDGEAIPSEFASDFATGLFDEDFREAQHLEQASQFVRDILKGFSYEDKIIPGIEDLLGELLPAPANVVLLLYNYRYNGGVEEKINDAVRLRYMGTIALE